MQIKINSKKCESGKGLEGSGCQVVDNTMTFPRETEENHEGFKTSGALAEIQIGHVQNTSTKKSPLKPTDW
jgi:hypothetical protein